ncbi:hypothetical protein ScPMuIL_005582 [Solemya velum]
MYQFVGPGRLVKLVPVLFIGFYFMIQSCQSMNPQIRYPPSYQQSVAYACENSLLYISCPEGELIRIIRANYGRFSISICNHRGITQQWDLQCMSTSTLKIVSERCDGRHVCTMKASNSRFHDNCPGTHKYLEVNYYCEPEDVSTPSNVSTSTPQPLTSPTPAPTLKTSKHFPRQPPTTTTSTTTTRPTTTTSVTTTTSTAASTTTPRKTVPPNHTTTRDSRQEWMNICPAESFDGTHWENARMGETLTKPCPLDKIGELQRRCSHDGWVDIKDISDCISPQMKNIEQMIEKSSISIAADELREFTSGQTLDVGDLKQAASVLLPSLARNFHKEIRNKPANTRADTVERFSRDIVEAGSNLLSEKQTYSWEQMVHQKRNHLANLLTVSMEETAFEVAASIEVKGHLSTVDENILMEVNVLDTYQYTTDLHFPSEASLEHTAWEEESDRIVIPRESLTNVAENGKVEVVFLVYHNLDMWMSSAPLDNEQSDLEKPAEMVRLHEPGEPTYPEQYQVVQKQLIINTKIFSASFNAPQQRTQLLKPISFTLKHRVDSVVIGGTPICSHWKYSESSSSGHWSGSGCRLISSNQSHTSCECDHLTNFAVLMDVTGSSTKIAAHHDLMLRAISIVGCTVSIICLALSFITFVAFKNLQCDRNTIHKNLVLCLLVAELIFLFGLSRSNDKILCAVIAGFLHFFFLASFAWMCLEGIQLYVMLIEVFEAEKSRIKWYYLFGYGLPALIVGIAAAVDHTGYGTETHCWLRTDNYFIWSFVGPVAAIITVNIVMLSIAIYMMCRHASSASSYKVKEKSQLQKTKAWVKGAIVLVVLLGLTWGFGFLFLNEETVAMAYIFTILNTLQGLFIFVFHCIMNEKVKKEYRKFLQRSTCLPDCIRGSAGYHGNQSNSPNPSSSSSGNYLLKLWSGRRRKRSSTSTLTQSSLPSKVNYRKSNISSYLSRESSFLPGDKKHYSNHSEKPLLSDSNGHAGAQAYLRDGAIAGDLSVMDCSVVDSEYVSEYCHNNLQVSQEVKRYSSGSELSYKKSCESVDKNRLSMLSEDSAIKRHSDFLPSEDMGDASNLETTDDECEKQNNLNQPEQKPLLCHTESEQDLIDCITNTNPVGDSMNIISKEKKSSPSLTEINQKLDNTPNKTNLSMPNLEVKPDGLERTYKEEEFGSHDALLYSLPDLSGIDEQSSGLEQTLSQSTNLRPKIKIVPRKKVTRLSSDAQVKFDPHRFSLENKYC